MISESSADKKAEFARYQKLLTPESLAKANPGNGRALFNQTCFACHTLFGEGNQVGPDITGGNRMNLDFLLENILDPSAVMAREYQLTVFTMNDGRVISGMIRNENDSAVRVAMVGADEQLLPKVDIGKRQPVPISMMPEGILSPFNDEQVRDLVAYLQSSKQVRMSEPGETFFEGEHLKVAKVTGGNARPQPMGGFKADSWTGNSHLWWVDGKPGSELSLEFTVPEAGRYVISSALTKARDYGIFQVALDGDTVIAEKVDLFSDPEVVTTGELNWGEHALKAGPHTLIVKVTGSNPAAVHRHMFGIDYLRLVKQK
jgi:putative heme-binding domain-containing protein